MNEEQNDNLQLGFAEIWRREKLAVASIALSALFALLVVVPVGYFLGGVPALLVALIPFALVAKCWIWVSSTPCPQCGRPYGGNTPSRKCCSCGLKMQKPESADYSISFKRIEYEPIEKFRA